MKQLWLSWRPPHEPRTTTAATAQVALQRCFKEAAVFSMQGSVVSVIFPSVVQSTTLSAADEPLYVYASLFCRSQFGLTLVMNSR